MHQNWRNRHSCWETWPKRPKNGGNGSNWSNLSNSGFIGGKKAPGEKVLTYGKFNVNLCKLQCQEKDPKYFIHPQMKPGMPMHFNALTSAGLQSDSILQSCAISSSWMQETALKSMPIFIDHVPFNRFYSFYKIWSYESRGLNWSRCYLSAIGYRGIFVILPQPRCGSNCGGLCRAAAVSSKFFTPQPSNPAMTGA